MPRPGFDPTDPDSEGFADPGSDPRFYDNTPAPIATQEVARHDLAATLFTLSFRVPPESGARIDTDGAHWVEVSADVLGEAATDIERLTRERDEARTLAAEEQAWGNERYEEAYYEMGAAPHLWSERALRAEARVASLTDQVGKLKAALGGLVDRLDVVHDDPRYRAVWELNQLRNGPYIGPNYWAELNAARAVLATEPDGESRG